MESLTVAVPNRTSFLSRHTIVERVCSRKLDALLASDYLLAEWTSKACWFVDSLKRVYQNEKKQITDYAASYNNEVRGVIVTYYPNKHMYGRMNVGKSLGFTCMRRPVRHTVADEYYDFDIINCQPAAIVYVLSSYGAPVPGPLRAYVSNRNDIIQLHMDAWNIKPQDKWLVKQLFIRLFFMGGYDQYREDMRDHGYSIPIEPTGFVSSLQRCLLDVAKTLQEHNPALHKIAQNKRKETNDAHGTKTLKTFMALYLQTVERNVVEFVMESIHNTTDLMKRPESPGYVFTSYEYDGFKLLKENVDKYPGGKEEVCRLLTLITAETKLPLQWSVKELDEAFDLSVVELPEASMNDLIHEMNMCCQSHRMFAEVVKARYSDNKYLYEVRDKQWYTFDTSSDSWEASDFFLLRDMGRIVDTLYNVPAFMKNDKYKNAYNSSLTKSGSSSWISGVQKMAQCVMYCKQVDFDTDKDLLNFDNGVYDITKGEFRKRSMTDFLTMSTGYDYTEMNSVDATYKEDVMFVLKQIHPDEEDLKLNLMIMASGLSGRCLEKFFVFNGSGRNGKSLLNSAMQIILGDYYTTAVTTILTEDLRKKSSSEANSAIASLNKSRYTVFREPPKNLPIQNSVVKDFTGGGEISSRELFKKSKPMTIDFTMVLETNSKPPFAETCGDAEAERVIDYHFVSHFTADEKKLEKAKEEKKHVYPLRTELKDKQWWVKRRIAFLHILLNSLNELRDADYNIAKFVPEHVKLRSKNYCESSVLVVRLFHELFYLPEEKVDEPYTGWDRDMTIANAVSHIRRSENFSCLPGSTRYSRDAQPTAMKQSLELHVEERLEMLYESHRQKFIRNFRLKYEAVAEDSSSEFDLISSAGSQVDTEVL